MFGFKKRRLRGSPLDAPLLRWTNQDLYTTRHLLAGGLLILGGPGSGKTSSSGKEVARSVLGLPGSGGLILGAKPEDRGMWERRFREMGRSGDLVIFAPGQPWCFDFLNYEMRQGGQTRNIARLIMTIGETLRSGDRQKGENSDFWEREQERMLYNAVQIVKVACGEVTADDLQQFMATAPRTSEEIRTPEWQAGFHNRCLQKVCQTSQSPQDFHDGRLAIEYWLGELPRMASKTRTSIETGVNSILHIFNTGIVRSLVSSGTNISPDDMRRGKWILVDMSPSEWSDVGNFVNAGWKYLTQKMILRRAVSEGDAVIGLWLDEYQQFVNSFDQAFLAQSRSHLGYTVALTQNLSGLYAAMHGAQGHHLAEALTGCFSHTLVHASDPITAQWASSKLGKKLETFVGGSMSPSGDLWDELCGRSQFTGSFSEHYESVLQPNVFMNGLRTGGAVNGLMCDAILLRNGQPFSNGQNWLSVSFSQK